MQAEVADAPIQLVVPMSGQGQRFVAAGYSAPKPLIDVAGEPMVARVLAQYPAEWPAHFVLASNHVGSDLPQTLRRLRPRGSQTVIAPHSEGPGRAIEAALPLLDPDAPVLVSYCDFGLIWDAAQFARFVAATRSDACLVSYRGFQPHYARPTPYAYSRLDRQGEQVLEVREKGSFTSEREREYASAGAYYFRTARLLAAALAHQRTLALRHKGELYTSLTVEALRRLDAGANIRVFAAEAFMQWGTPEDLADYVYWHRAWQAKLATAHSERGQVAQVALPMAGVGSRFRALTATPKPLIALDGRPMYERALASLPGATSAQAFAVRQSEQAAVCAQPSCGPAPIVVGLPTTPPGQALSTQAALARLAPEAPVLVSSCDHAIGLDPGLWRAFAANPRADAAIFTIKGYPGAARSPKSYAYVQTSAADRAAGERFAGIEGVSVKVPISDRPAQDPVLVGTFWCSSVALLQRGIEELVARDLRVNGELYLDSVFALLLAAGRSVREIPLSGYFNWGAPDALYETCYWERVFTGTNSNPFAGSPPASN